METTAERLRVDDPTQGSLELAVRLARPSAATDRDLGILYFHGLGSRQDGEKADFFRARSLASGLAFCSFDFRGHGASAGDLFGLSMTRNLADSAVVHGFLRDHGFSRLILLGSSMGAGTALWHAVRHPRDVVAVICVAPALAMEQELLKAAGPAGIEAWRQQGRFTLRSELLTCDLSWQLIEDLRAYDIHQLQAVYRTPTLIFQGKKDTSVPWRPVLEFATACRFEEIELHLMADGDHRLVDRLEYLWQMMVGFLVRRSLLPETAR